MPGSIPPDVRLAGLSVAVPPYRLGQEEVRELCRHIFNPKPRMFERLSQAYLNAGIDFRHSCVPIDWYAEEHDWVERSRLFEENALMLLERAAHRALAEAGLAADQIDAVVTVCSTGISTPTLEALLSGPMGFRSDVVRLPIFGLGCAGGVSGLARASDIARAMPGRRVLLLVVELCALTFRAQELTKANVIASALFGDGAAAAVVTSDPHVDEAPSEASVHVGIGASAEHLWPDSRQVMGWRVENDGLGVIFSQDIPSLIHRDLKEVADRFLSAQGLDLEALDGLLAHPGGTKVMEAYEGALGLPAEAFDVPRHVLRNYGNMSAVTVLAVLREALDRGYSGRHMMMALGPGFTASFQLVDLL